MILYLIAAAIGFVAAKIMDYRRSSPFEENLLRCVYAGKRVMIAVDDDAHVFVLENGKLVIKQAEVSASETKADLQTEMQSASPTEQDV